MDEDKVVQRKSRLFASRIVKLYKHPVIGYKEYVLSKQVLRSGTSIGANIAEAECAISKQDFLAKFYIAHKECSETEYWLWLLKDNNYLNDKEFHSIYTDCLELRRLLTAITKTTEAKLKRKKQVQETPENYGIPEKDVQSNF